MIGLSRRAALVPLALGADGHTLFASLDSKAFSGVIKLDVTSGRITRIRRFPNRMNDSAGGSFDGRWLVWGEYHSLYGLDDFTTWSWDSRTGRVRQLGAAERAPSGEFWPSSWREPDVRGGFATWEQGSGADGVGDVHVVDLSSGRDLIVRHGHAQGSFMVTRRMVVWPESLKPDATTVMQAADVTTGRLVSPPPAFRRIRGASGLMTDGTGVAYPNGDYTALWWSPSLSQAPREVYATHDPAIHVDNTIQVAGRYVFFGVAPRSYLADTRTGRYIQISAGGWARLDRKALVLLPPSSKKAIHLVANVYFYPLAALPPIPRCR